MASLDRNRKSSCCALQKWLLRAARGCKGRDKAVLLWWKYNMYIRNSVACLYISSINFDTLTGPDSSDKVVLSLRAITIPLHL